VKLHALVEDLATAHAAVEGGATVVQLRVKHISTRQLVELGRPLRELDAMLVVNDDVTAAIRLEADGVHLGREDEGVDRALEAGLRVGRSAWDVGEAIAAERSGATYIGAGPVWETPSKDDLDPPIGLDGLAGIVDAVGIPVVAIGGIDATNAGACIAVGAEGVAVIRAARDAHALREAIDEALAAR
jgi:thiamine-phosphate pyrophosphorylase